MANNDKDLLINLINLLSFAIGIQNLDINEKQITQLENHLKKQDEQYERIIELLEQGGTNGRRK